MITFHFLRSFLFFMKIFVLNFFVFGVVTACGLKESSNTTPKEKIKGVRFRHLNLSTHQLNETKIIDITSSITLSLQDPVKFKNHSLIESKCFNTYLEGFSGLSKIENSQKLPVKDILPPKAFTPTSNSGSELHCDFKIEVFNGKQKMALILLNDIRITNIENYHDFSLPFSLKDSNRNQGKPLYIQKKDLKNLKLTLPLNKGEILTLCDGSKKTQSFNGRIFPISDFFSQELFEEKNLSLCRLVACQKNPSRTWVSDSFLSRGRNQRSPTNITPITKQRNPESVGKKKPWGF